MYVDINQRNFQNGGLIQLTINWLLNFVDVYTKGAKKCLAYA